MNCIASSSSLGRSCESAPTRHEKQKHDYKCSKVCFTNRMFVCTCMIGFQSVGVTSTLTETKGTLARYIRLWRASNSMLQIRLWKSIPTIVLLKIDGLHHLLKKHPEVLHISSCPECHLPSDDFHLPRPYGYTLDLSHLGSLPCLYNPSLHFQRNDRSQHCNDNMF